MQVLVNLEPVELKLVPELLAALVHDIGDALITILLLLDVLVFLFFIVIVGRLSVPKIIHLVLGHLLSALRLSLHLEEVLDFSLELLFLLTLLLFSLGLSLLGLFAGSVQSIDIVDSNLLGPIDEVVLDFIVGLPDLEAVFVEHFELL